MSRVSHALHSRFRDVLDQFTSQAATLRQRRKKDGPLWTSPSTIPDRVTQTMR